MANTAMNLSDVIGPNASVPGPVAGYWRAVPEWSLAGNDRFGDCTFVSLCNLIDLVTAVNGDPQVVGEAEAEYFYAREAGFDPNVAATDKGAVLADVIRFWAEQGWPSDPTCKPLGWSAIKPFEIHQAVHSLGAVPAWCVLPMVNGDWDFTDHSHWTKGTGAHAILIVESNPTGLKVVTWGEIRNVSHAWWSAFGAGQYAIKHPEWRVPLA